MKNINGFCGKADPKYKKNHTLNEKDNSIWIESKHGERFLSFLFREDYFWITTKKGRLFCKSCHHSQDNMSKCSKCGSDDIITLSTKARVPKKKANKRKWKKFINLFVE
jgi:hypothetical protein